MNKFQFIKDAVSIYDVIGYYGYKIKKNYMHCCFHDDKTESMSFKNNIAHCFGCGVHEDVIGFVCLHDNLTPLEAIKFLNNVFVLGLDFNVPTGKFDCLRAQIIKLTRERDKLKNSHAFSAIYRSVYPDRREEYYKAEIFLTGIDKKLDYYKRELLFLESDIDKFFDTYVQADVNRKMNQYIEKMKIAE